MTDNELMLSRWWFRLLLLAALAAITLSASSCTPTEPLHHRGPRSRLYLPQVPEGSYSVNQGGRE